MLNKLYRKLKAIAGNMAVAFFFSCLFLTITYLLFNKRITTYIKILNKLSVESVKVEKTNVVFDDVAKRIKNYPDYGTVWAKIIIDKINVNINVYEGHDLNILKNGAGHMQGSYFPLEGGSIIIGAHNTKTFFRYLEKLEVNDIVTLDTNYGKFDYKVTSYGVYNTSDLAKRDIDSSEELVLYTCYPYESIGYKTQRYVVILKLAGDKNE